jgi:hypothetical protein
MATLGQITAKISERLLDPQNVAVSVSSVVDSINDAIRYWKFRRFWFNEVSDTAQMTQGNGDFPYPSDFLVPATNDGGFVIEYSGMRYPITKISMPQYEAIFLDNGFGQPRYYARIGDEEYQAYPLPDRDYDVRRHYLKDYVALVNTSDTNDFTTYADRLITLWSLADLSGELRQDDQMEAYFRSRAEVEYNSLMLMTRKTNATGRLEVDCL